MRPLGIGRDDETLCEPVVQRLVPVFHMPNAQPSLQFLNKPILGLALVKDDRTQLGPLVPVPVHGVYIGNLLGASDHRLELPGAQISSGRCGTGSNDRHHASIPLQSCGVQFKCFLNAAFVNENLQYRVHMQKPSEHGTTHPVLEGTPVPQHAVSQALPVHLLANGDDTTSNRRNRR